jgi:hypothetical protein
VPSANGGGRGVIADLAGNVVVAGSVDDATGGSTFVAVSLASTDGAEVWRSPVEGETSPSADDGYGVALDPSGNLVASGRREVASGREIAAVRLACNGAATPVDCSGQLVDDCTFGGGCDPGTGQCSTGPRPDGGPCNDENACTQDDACQGGACAGTAVVCVGQCQSSGECNPATGACSSTPVADGTACDDADACTSSDACQAGTCTAAGPEVVSCALDGAVGGASCAGQKLPRGAKKNLKKAKKLVTKAVAQASATKRGALLGKAGTALGKAGNAVDKAAARARKPLAAACAQALKEAIARAQAAVTALGQ